MYFSKLLGSWLPELVMCEVKSLLLNEPKYIDIGCGDGALTEKIAEILEPSEVYGIDLDRAALLKASRRGIIVAKCDASSLPFKDESFDVATALELLEHLNDPLKALKEAFRILKAEGVFIVETPNAIGCGKKFLADQLKLIMPDLKTMSFDLIDAKRTKGFTPKSLRMALIESGFEVLKVYGVHHPPPGAPALIEEIREESSSIPHIVALAKKSLKVR